VFSTGKLIWDIISAAKFFLIVFFISLIGLVISFDKIRVSLFHSDLATFDIKEVEANGVGNKRYLQINKGVWDGSLVYEAETYRNGEIDSFSKVKSVIIPLMSRTEFDSQTENGVSKIRVLVKFNMPDGTTVSNLEGVNPLISGNIADPKKVWKPEQTKEIGEEFSVNGLTLVGINSLDSKSRKLLTSLEHEISPDVIFIEAGSKPGSLTYGLIILGISLVGFIGSPIIAYGNYLAIKDNVPMDDDEPISLNLND
jgi:hypothetical protein